MIAKVCDRESRQDTLFENRLVLCPFQKASVSSLVYSLDKAVRGCYERWRQYVNNYRWESQALPYDPGSKVTTANGHKRSGQKPAAIAKGG